MGEGVGLGVGQWAGLGVGITVEENGGEGRDIERGVVLLGARLVVADGEGVDGGRVGAGLGVGLGDGLCWTSIRASGWASSARGITSLSWKAISSSASPRASSVMYAGTCCCT